MRDADKSKDQLLKELSRVRQRVGELEQAVCAGNTTEHKPIEDAIPPGHLLERLKTEVNERKRMEEALRASQDRYASILRAAPTGIGVVVDRVITEGNQVLCGMTGYTSQELIGKSARMLYPTEEEFDFVGREKYRQIADRGIGSVETRWQRKDGTIIDVLLSSAPIDPRDLSKGVTFTAVDITERKQAEEALAEELNHRRVLFEQSPDGILIIDTQTARFLDFNTAAHMQLGYSREEFAKLGIPDVEVKETDEETKAHVAKVVKNGRDDFETIQRTKQGEIRNVHVTAQLITIQGHPVYHCIWRDVTDHKRAEEALYESESKFRALAENTTAVIFVIQEDKYVYINPAFTTVTGYTFEDLSSMNFWDLISPDMRELVRARGAARQRKDDVPPHYDLKFVTKSGEERYGSFGATLIEYQGRPAILGSVLDVTERRRMEDALREREKTLQTFLDAVHETLVLIDTKGTIILSNVVAAERLGKTVPEIVGTCVYDYFPPDIVKHRKEQFERVVATGQPVSFEDTRMGRSFEQYCCPLFDEGRNVTGVSIFASDITARKQAERELRQSEEKYRSIFENAVEGFYQTTPEGRFLSVNRALAGTMGFASPEEMIATYTDIGKQHYVNLEDRTRFATLLEQQGNVQAFETQLRRKGGDSIWVSMSGRAVRGASGNILYYEGNVVDITKRKKDEEALRLSEEKFAKAFAMNPATVAITALIDGRIIEVNETGLKMFGYSRDEVLGTSVSLSLWPTPEDRERFVRVLREKGSFHSREQTLVRRSGEHFVTLASAKLLTLAGEEVVLSTWLDISDRKKAEEELRESEARFKSLVEGAPEAIFVQAEGRLIYVNPAMLNLLRVSEPKELLDKESVTWVAPKYHEAIRERIRLQLESGKPAPPMEQEYLRLDGSRVSVEVTAVLVRFRGADAHLVFVRDITERKQAEEALRQSEEMYRTLIAASPDAITVTDLSGRITLVSRKALELFGIPSENHAIGHSVAEWITQEDQREAGLLAIQELLAKDGARSREFVLRKGDGTVFDAEIHAAPIQSLDGTVRGAILITRDITERKDLQAQLLQAQKMEAIGTLAGGVAHDFNNILMAMMGFTGLIGMKITEDHEIRNYLNQMQDCTSRAANVTRSLLAFSRKQAMELKPQSTNIIVKELEKLLRRLVPEDVEFTLTLNEDVTIMADMTQIDQVLINLVSNARDAMPKGGALHIETKAIEFGQEFKQKNGFGEPGRYGMISVADTGGGMDKATQKKIFEPFFTTKEVGKGTGLGLSIVYGIVKQHEGYITVSSEPGKGTTFNVYLPAVKGEVSEIGQTDADVKGGTETILLAEDNAEVRGVAGEILRTSGYTIVEAEDGEDAVRKYTEHRGRIDLLVLDVVMPGKNGKEAYEEIRRIDSSVRVLFMSGYTGDVVLDKGIQDATVNYIAKPLSAHELLKKIREVLGR